MVLLPVALLLGLPRPASCYNCQIFKPEEGTVFVVGEPVEVQWNIQGLNPWDYEYVQLWVERVDIPARPYTEDNDGRTTSTILRFEEPGQYILSNWLYVPGGRWPSGCGGVHVTILEGHGASSITGSKVAKVTWPRHTGQPQISIPDGEILGAVTKDGALAHLEAVAVRNVGDATLTLGEIEAHVVGEKVRIAPAIPVAGTRIPPGTAVLIPFRLLPNLEYLQEGTYRITQNLFLWSDSRGGEVRVLNAGVYIYPDASSVPPTLLPPDCRDSNGDGSVDASDVIQVILETGTGSGR
ncbi:hypothetical protein HZA57_04725 [Candidatus Poribacteria bacterium]|nr:hypothetical protein [Candidatus Poribacteria bacterium]